MGTTFLSFLISKQKLLGSLAMVFVFLFSSYLPVISSSNTLENRIKIPRNITEEDVLELKDQIVSNLENALSLVKDGERKQAIISLKLALKDINTFVIWEDYNELVELPENAKASKKQIRQAIKLLKNGDMDTAKVTPLIETAIVIWTGPVDEA